MTMIAFVIMFFVGFALMHTSILLLDHLSWPKAASVTKEEIEVEVVNIEKELEETGKIKLKNTIV